MLKVLESPVYYASEDSQTQLNDFRYLLNCIWYVLVTMATVGYGEYYPKTLIGRLVGILSALTGTIIVSILIISLQQMLKLSPLEMRTIEFVDRLSYKEMIKKESAAYMKLSYKYTKMKNEYLKETQSSDRDKKKIKNRKKKLKKCMYDRITTQRSFKKMLQ